MSHRKNITPGYHTQNFSLDMLMGACECCGTCKHSDVHYRMCSCNFIRSKNNTSKGKRLCALVKFYAICDKYERKDTYGFGIPEGLCGTLKIREEEFKEEVLPEYEGDAVQENGIHTAESKDGHTSTTMGKENSLRISPIKEDKTITIAIPRQKDKGIQIWNF